MIILICQIILNGFPGFLQWALLIRLCSWISWVVFGRSEISIMHPGYGHEINFQVVSYLQLRIESFLDLFLSHNFWLAPQFSRLIFDINRQLIVDVYWMVPYLELWRRGPAWTFSINLIDNLFDTNRWWNLIVRNTILDLLWYNKFYMNNSYHHIVSRESMRSCL